MQTPFRATRQELEAMMDPATLAFVCDACTVRTNHVTIIGLARGGAIALCLNCR
jgi:spermidine synthase